jgi:hypothetical protein
VEHWDPNLACNYKDRQLMLVSDKRTSLLLDNLKNDGSCLAPI